MKGINVVFELGGGCKGIAARRLGRLGTRKQ